MKGGKPHLHTVANSWNEHLVQMCVCVGVGVCGCHSIFHFILPNYYKWLKQPKKTL